MGTILLRRSIQDLLGDDPGKSLGGAGVDRWVSSVCGYCGPGAGCWWG